MTSRREQAHVLLLTECAADVVVNLNLSPAVAVSVSAAVAMGATLAFGRIGSVISVNVSALFSSSQVPLAYAFASGTCAVSVIAAIIASFLDWRWELRARDRAAAAAIGAADSSLMPGEGAGAAYDDAGAGSGAGAPGGHGHGSGPSRNSSSSMPSSASKRQLSTASAGGSLRQLLSADAVQHVLAYEMSAPGQKGSISTAEKAKILRGPSRWWWQRGGSGSSGSRDFYGEAEASRVPSTAEPSEPLLSKDSGDALLADAAPKRGDASVRSHVTFADEAHRVGADEELPCCGRCCRRASAGIRLWCLTLSSFKPGFWLLCGISVAGFAPITTCNSYLPAQLRLRAIDAGQQPDLQALNAAAGILYTAAAATAPFMGALVDRARAHAALILTSQALIVGVHVSLALLQRVGEIPFIAALGLLFATFASAFWSSLAGYVPAVALGQAYGLVGAIQNMGLAAAPYVAAQLQPPGCATYACMEFFFAGCAAVAAALAAVLVALRYRDRRRAATAARKRLRTASLLADAELKVDEDLTADAATLRRSIGCAADGIAFAAAAAAAASDAASDAAADRGAYRFDDADADADAASCVDSAIRSTGDDPSAVPASESPTTAASGLLPL